MKSERIGNDIKIEWSILREGTPFSLSNKDVSIYLGSQFGRTKISGFTIDSNKVIWTFFGKDQKSLGKYSLVLVINEGNEGMITTDICDFVNLVSCSCEVGGTDNEDVQTETIALTSNLEYVASEYYDDTAIWEYIEKMEKAKADKAEIPTRVSQLENDAEYATVGDLGGKQDKISDLDAIRRGAQKGATALQEIPAEYVNDKELDNALRPKVNRYEVATINGQSILNGGNIVIEGGGSGGGSYDDTEIRDELAELSERIDNLPSAESSVFKAVYGVTTHEEIKAAYDSGKVVHCDYENNCYILSRFISNEAYFSCVKDNFSYRLYCSNASVWSKASFPLEKTANKVTSLSSSSTDTQYPSAKAVYDALPTLETLPNGNLKVTIDGESKDFMPATPSGDPMHYMFEAVGAEYNNTGADIVRTGIYGDTITWKAGYWWLNELGDITNEEMRGICTAPIGDGLYWNRLFASYPYRTNRKFYWYDTPYNVFELADQYATNALLFSQLETFLMPTPLKGDVEISLKIVSSFAYQANKLEKILNAFSVTGASSAMFMGAVRLREVRLKKVAFNLYLKDCQLLSTASILYMIQNEAATSAIVITLHADAYDRVMADAEITAALAAHPNVSLAK